MVIEINTIDKTITILEESNLADFLEHIETYFKTIPEQLDEYNIKSTIPERGFNINYVSSTTQLN